MILHRAAIFLWLKWDAAHFFEWLATRGWYTQILEDWVAAVPLTTADCALEIGCGPGWLTHHLHQQGTQVTGLDRSPAMVERARAKHPACSFIQGDALAIPVDDDTFTASIAASVVNLVSDPSLLVSEMKRSVKSGGRVSVLFPTPKLTTDVNELIERHHLRGLCAAALGVWASKAPKRESAAIVELFEHAALNDVTVHRFFDDTIASVTGVVA